MPERSQEEVLSVTLRIMLVGLVASLGFELPSDNDLSRWSRSGREWVAARLAGFPGPPVEADQPVVETADVPTASPTFAEVPDANTDRSFEAASAAMVS